MSGRRGLAHSAGAPPPASGPSNGHQRLAVVHVQALGVVPDDGRIVGHSETECAQTRRRQLCTSRGASRDELALRVSEASSHHEKPVSPVELATIDPGVMGAGTGSGSRTGFARSTWYQVAPLPKFLTMNRPP